MTRKTHPLGKIRPNEFLEKYWQKKPLLVRNAFPDFHGPITPDDLAGIACQELSTARLVRNTPGKRDWTVEHGPFDENLFASLPKTHWTILVQEMENWIPEIEDIRRCFSFIPDWRCDDVMVSYASDKGSVGPHIDQYDVFLLQGMGQRRWQIESRPVHTDDFIPGLDLRILKEFNADQELILNPGDMLYLPPRFPHFGVASGPCMTYSIGFRAPSASEMLQAFMDLHGDELEHNFYSDPDLSMQRNPGEISKDALKRAVSQLLDALSSEDDAVHWFGRLVTQNKRHDRLPPPKTRIRNFPALLSKKSTHKGLCKTSEVRFAFNKGGGGQVNLFIDGSQMILSPGLLAVVKKLCANHIFSLEELRQLDSSSGTASFLLELYNQGYLVAHE